jgi:hypothetical protein
MPGWGGWADDQARRGPPKWQLDAEKKAAKVGRVRTPFRSVPFSPDCFPDAEPPVLASDADERNVHVIKSSNH